MFREGHYLEVIKASDSCLATAIVTIKEKTVEYKKKKITTNKWLDLQDWASVYSIIRKAIIRNYESKANGRRDTTERRKSTSHLEVKYKFETTDSSEEQDPLPTIRVSVAPVRKRTKSSNDRKPKSEEEEVKDKNEKLKAEVNNDRTSSTQQFNENDSFLLDNYSLEEYVPPELPSATKASTGLDYVPSRKSVLSRMRSSTDANKYTPTTSTKIASNTSAVRTEVSYVPNSIKSLAKVVHEGYDPCGESTLSTDLSAAYVPSSKGTRTEIEEYQPNFASKTMTFDDSYVPSSVYKNATSAIAAAAKESKKRRRKSHDSRNNKKTATSRSLISKIAKREL